MCNADSPLSGLCVVGKHAAVLFVRSISDLHSSHSSSSSPSSPSVLSVRQRLFQLVGLYPRIFLLIMMETDPPPAHHSRSHSRAPMLHTRQYRTVAGPDRRIERLLVQVAVTQSAAAAGRHTTDMSGSGDQAKKDEEV